MSVIGRINDTAISGVKYETPIATTELRHVKFYQNTLYPYLLSLATDAAKAFYFDIGAGNVKTASAYAGITNKMQSYAPAIAENGATASVVGWGYHSTRASFFFVTFYNSPTNGIEYAIHEYTVATKAITTVSVVTHAAGALAYTPPNENSLFIDETAGRVYFIYNDTNTLTGAFAYLDIATSTVTGVTSFTAARANYEEIHLRNVKYINGYVFIVGDMVDTAGAVNTIGFIYGRSLASMPAAVNVNAAGAAIYLSDAYFPAAVAEFNVSSVVVKDTIYSDYFIHGAIFGTVDVGAGDIPIAATFRFQYVDLAMTFESITVLDTITSVLPGQSVLLERQIKDIIILAEKDSAATRALKSLTLEPAAQLGGGTRGTQYSSLAKDSTIVSPAIGATEFSLSVAMNCDAIATAAFDVAMFYLGTTGAPGTLTGKLRLNSGAFEFYIADTGGTLRLAASTTALSVPNARQFTFAIQRDKYGVWSAQFNGTAVSVTYGVGGALVFNTGNYVSLYGAGVGIVATYTDLSLTAENVALWEGIPGSQATQGGVYAGIASIRTVVEMDSFYSHQYWGPAGGFDVYDMNDENVYVYFCQNTSAGESYIQKIFFDYVEGTKNTDFGGCYFGLSSKGARALAPCYDPSSCLLHPVLCAPLDVTVASPLLDFVITRVDGEISFSLNEAEIDVAFVTSHASIVAGTEQIDNLAFYDNELVASVSNFVLTGLPYTALTLIDPAYPIAIQGEPGHVDILRRKSSPTSESFTMYRLWRGDVGTRYNYSPSLNTFYASANGLFYRETVVARMQDEYEDFDAYIDTTNLTISQILEEVKSEAIELFVKLAVSQLIAETSWASDTNYSPNNEKKYMPCGSAEETARFDDGTGLTVRFAGSKQIEIKTTEIDQRTARSFKVRVSARLTDTAANKYYDDFKVFHIVVKSDPGVAIEGDRENG